VRFIKLVTLAQGVVLVKQLQEPTVLVYQHLKAVQAVEQALQSQRKTTQVLRGREVLVYIGGLLLAVAVSAARTPVVAPET